MAKRNSPPRQPKGKAEATPAVASGSKAARAAVGLTFNASPTVRLLKALQLAEAMSTIGPKASPAWAAATAAKTYNVPLVDLACLLLDKLTACQRARAELEAIRAADEEFE
jgi:hypothetical protein